MSDTSTSKSKGPKAVIEQEPAVDEPEEGAVDGSPAQGAAAQATAALEQAAQGFTASAAAKATKGYLRLIAARMWNYSLENPNTVFYSLVGFVLAIMVLTLGIWTTLVIAVFVAVGAIYGQVRDGKNGVVNFIANLLEGGGGNQE